jgi:uridylate kinase
MRLSVMGKFSEVPAAIASLMIKRKSYEAADDECKSGSIVVFSGGDNVPFLTGATVAGLDLHRSEVLPEVS